MCAQLATRATGDPGWLRGLSDPGIGAALSLIHAHPERPWSVASLAREVRISRSLLAQRFRRLVGRGPIEYLAEWRMFEAAGRLSEGRLPLKAIALAAGHGSAAAFGRAFRRRSGDTPDAARRGG